MDIIFVKDTKFSRSCLVIIKYIFVLVLIASSTFISGCSSIYWQQQIPKYSSPSAQNKIAIFFDGTANDVESDTNVKRLHSLMSLQNKPELSTLYVEGVGVNNDLLGASAGVGFEARVVLAYNFLLTHYKAGDQIYIFGFSRGAYQARALASMLHYVGLPDAPQPLGQSLLFEDQVALARKLFREMKESFNQRHYPCQIAAVRGKVDFSQQYKSRAIEVLGLWDTVDALGGGITGWPDRLLDKSGIKPLHINIDSPNVRYGDQILNVKHAFHAVSLDDDREWIFTPQLMTRAHLVSQKFLPNKDELANKFREDCPAGTPNVNFPAKINYGFTPEVQEVWFPGAHSDVGGGYADSELPGLSLNWMIENLNDTNASSGLLPLWSMVRQDVYGSSHNPEAGKWSPVYHRKSRNLAAYALGEHDACALGPNLGECSARGMHEPQSQFKDKLCMHESVFTRRSAMPPRAHENLYLTLREPGWVCVKDSGQLANPPILIQVHASDIFENSCPDKSKKIYIGRWSESSHQCEYPDKWSE